MQRKIWDGWTVEWAHRGIVDLAEYVSYPKERVLTDRNILSEAEKVMLSNRQDPAFSFGAYKPSIGECKFFVLPNDTENYLFNGIDLAAQCREVGGLSSFMWTDWEKGDEFPHGGFLIDESEKVVEFWQVQDCPDVIQDLKKIWEGWDVIWHEDRFESITARFADSIVLPEMVESDLIKQLRDSLIREDQTPTVASALDFSEKLEDTGLKIDVSPWFSKSHYVEHKLKDKLNIWDKYLGDYIND